jgi:hypothetical protein
MTNTLFPGRPDYTGPTVGIFGLLHHDTLCEYSHDVNERITYVKNSKLLEEIPIRLYSMIYLGDCAGIAKVEKLYTKGDKLRAEGG